MDGIRPGRSRGRAGHRLTVALVAVPSPRPPSRTPLPSASSGSSTTGPVIAAPKTEARLRERWPAIRVVHTPIHASWLNQVELYFSVVQRKVLDPNQWSSATDLEAVLLAFGERYSAIAKPFEWRFTHGDLRRVLAALPAQTAAA
jgi:hypothetical protein